MNKKYQIIYADPPWQYQAWSERGETRSAKAHYETVGNGNLIQLQVNDLAEKDCVLLMWATYPKLIEALEFGASWGFTYKTVAFTWVKKNTRSDSPFVGMGYYTRSNAEIVLLFTKGKPIKRINKDVQQVIFDDEVVYSPIGKHSQKPDEIRKRIVRLFGDLPRVELFARSREGFFPDYEYEGWDVFGNQVNNSIKIPA